MIQWKDTSSHSKDDKEKIPNSFTYEIGKFKVTIHRHIHYPKDQWLCSCHLLNVEKVELMNKITTKAQEEALNYIENILREYEVLLNAFKKQRAETKTTDSKES